MNAIMDEITVQIEETRCDDSDDVDMYKAFTFVDAKIFRSGTAKAIGAISAMLVDRQKSL